MVVGPCFFKSVREKFNRLNTLWPEDQKTSRSGAETADKPKNIFHSLFLFFPMCFISRWMREWRWGLSQ
jgi:hypothetical protein